jgi:5-dehydro-4-deoxyglucarate dehydratase
MLPSGVLSFPLTAFDADGELDLPAFSAHLDDQVSSGPAAVFVACGTGEVSSLAEAEHADVVRTSVSVVAGRVPVFAGIGGGLATAKTQAGAAAAAGVDGVLLLPPYLVSGPPAGLLAYVAAVAAVSSTPLIVYRRATNLFGVPTALALLDVPNVVGIKDGNGDVDTMTRMVTAVRTSGHPRAEDFLFLNGLPTAELSAQAYRGIGIPQYSSAIFCCAPDISLAFAAALEAGNDAACQRLLEIFYLPFADLRDTTPGYHVSLVKAGARLRGFDVGGVRPPLIDPSPDHLSTLTSLITAARAELGAA